MPEPAMIDLLKVLQYLRKRQADYDQAGTLEVTRSAKEVYDAASGAYGDAINKLEQVLTGHQRTTEKFAENLRQVLGGR